MSALVQAVAGEKATERTGVSVVSGGVAWKKLGVATMSRQSIDAPAAADATTIPRVVVEGLSERDQQDLDCLVAYVACRSLRDAGRQMFAHHSSIQRAVVRAISLFRRGHLRIVVDPTYTGVGPGAAGAMTRHGDASLAETEEIPGEKTTQTRPA